MTRRIEAVLCAPGSVLMEKRRDFWGLLYVLTPAQAARWLSL